MGSTSMLWDSLSGYTWQDTEGSGATWESPGLLLAEPMPPIGGIQDGFDTDFDTEVWNLSSESTFTRNGFVKIPCERQINFIAAGDLDARDSRTSAYIVLPASDSRVVNSLSLQANGAAFSVSIIEQGGVLAAQRSIDGQLVSHSIGDYDPIEHAWWQITEEAGTARFWTSSNGNSWQLHWQIVHNLNMRDVSVAISTQQDGGLGSGLYMYVDNFNLMPSEVPLTKKPISMIRDRFRTEEIDRSRWANLFGEPEVSEQGLELASEVSFNSARSYSLEGSEIMWDFQHSPFQTDYLYLEGVGGFYIDEGELHIKNESGSPALLHIGPYSAIDHKFLRCTTDAGVTGGSAAPSTIVTVFDANGADPETIDLVLNGGHANSFDSVEPDSGQRFVRYDVSPDGHDWNPIYYHPYAGLLDSVRVAVESTNS